MKLFIIGHSPKRKKDANALAHLASVRCAQTNRLCMVDDKKRDTRLIYVKGGVVVTVNAGYALGSVVVL